MKFTVFLSGLLLLFLLPDWTESVEDTDDTVDISTLATVDISTLATVDISTLATVDISTLATVDISTLATVDINTLATVDINTLNRIINFFEKNYKRVDTDKHPRQYATAINVPKDQCQQNFNLNTFLTQEDAAIVKENITDETNALYQGSELIAAGTRKQNKYNMHSESLLLNPANNSPMSNLLNKRKDGCSVFYTFESPCVNTCLNPSSSHNIIDALEKWKQHDGIKAFVFKDFWKFDIKKDLQTAFKQIVAHVPLFRCVSENECYACRGEGNTPIDAHCLPPKEI